VESVSSKGSAKDIVDKLTEAVRSLAWWLRDLKALQAEQSKQVAKAAARVANAPFDLGL
jgi:hypothetical protein